MSSSLSTQQSAPPSRVATAVAVAAAAVTLSFGESLIGLQLEAIGLEFGRGAAALQWVVNAYMLAFAASILAMGILGDRIGHGRLFTLGLFFTGVANSSAIFAPSLDALIGLRALSGIGAGTLLATGPALLSRCFPKGSAENDVARGRVFAAFGAAAGAGIGLGPLAGGLLMDWLGSWRAVFAVYLPFVMIGFALLPWIDSSPGRRDAPVDRMGIALFAGALGLLLWALNGGPGTPLGLALLYLTVVLLVMALFVSERQHAHPAVDLRIFANPLFRTMALLLVCWQLGVAVSMIYLPAVAVAGLGLGPGLAGATTIPMAITLFATAPLGPWCVRRFGAGGFLGICCLLMIVGQGIIALTLRAPLPVALGGLLVGLLLIGTGGGIANGNMDNLAIGALPANRAGAASGAFQTVRIGAAAIAAAAVGWLLGLGSTASAAVAPRYALIASGNALLMALLLMLGLALLVRRRRG